MVVVTCQIAHPYLGASNSQSRQTMGWTKTQSQRGGGGERESRETDCGRQAGRQADVLRRTGMLGIGPGVKALSMLECVCAHALVRVSLRE